MNKMKKHRLKGVRTMLIKSDMAKSLDTNYKRVDLVFTNVDHRGDSYEVWAFINNKKASDETPRELKNGYAGRFIVFGHGGCFGDKGHCDYSSRKYSSFDLRFKHPLTPITKIITITKSLSTMVKNKTRLQSVTLVPIIRKPKLKDCKRFDSIMRFDQMEMRFYS